MSTDMKITETNRDNTIVLSLEGTLDTLSSPALQERLTSILKNNNDVELDLQELTYISSAGLRVLLIGIKAAQESGARLNVVNTREGVMEIFELTGFKEILKIP